ncbi:uncharacterized protein [Euwallacea fornicatus]|uniref:uncharacterized protein isoform X2 n=1 Tax=Euwallacea fornicatus TaxID=995702 RepID=UPI00338F2ECB
MSEEVTIDIDFKDVLELEKFLFSDITRILVVETIDAKLELARILNILRRCQSDKNDYGFNSISGDATRKSVSILNWSLLNTRLNNGEYDNKEAANLHIVDASGFRSSDPNYKNTLRTLFDHVHNSQVLKVIIICDKERICFNCMIARKYYQNFVRQIVVSDLGFDQLCEESKAKFMTLPMISCRGTTMSLRDFLQNDSILANSIIDFVALREFLQGAETKRQLFKMIINENYLWKDNMTTPLSKKLYNLLSSSSFCTDDNDFENNCFYDTYFLSGKLRNLLSSSTDIPDYFIFYGIEDKDALIKYMYGPRTKIRIKNFNNFQVVSHEDQALDFFSKFGSNLRPVHLIKTIPNENNFIWVKSKGTVRRIQKYKIIDRKKSSKAEILGKKHMILCGYSVQDVFTTLTELARNLANTWVITIDFSKFSSLSVNTEEMLQQLVVDFLSYFCYPHFLLHGMLNTYLFTPSNLPICLIFHGFDKVCQNNQSSYYSFILKVLKYLVEKSVARIWITCSAEYVAVLEDNLSIFCTVLEDPCSLKNYPNLRKKLRSFRHFSTSVRELAGNMSTQLSEGEKNTHSNVYLRLNAFVDFQFAAFVKKQFPSNPNNELITNYLYSIHSAIAIQQISPILKEIVDSVLEGCKINISQVGLVSRDLMFHDRILAEYFASLFFYKYILDPESCPMEQILIFDILLEPRYINVRQFLEFRMEESQLTNMPQVVGNRIRQLWQDKRPRFFSNGETFIHTLVRENLQNLLRWFLTGEFVEHILPCLFTKCNIWSLHLRSNVQDLLKSLLPSPIPADISIKKEDFATFNSVEKLISLVTTPIARTYLLSTSSTTALHLAVAQKNPNVESVVLLLDAGIPVDILDCNNATPLHYACGHGNLEIVEILLTYGADPNCRDKKLRTPLTRCVQRGHFAVATFLAGHSSVSDRNPNDVDNMSLLHHSVKSGDFGMVQLFVDENMDHKDKFGMTALSWATIAGNIQIVDFLIGSGAATDVRDQHGRNLLMLAVKFRRWQLVEYLVFCLVDVNVPDNDDISAVDCAATSGHWDIVQLLLKEGATPTNSGLINLALEANQLSAAFLLIKSGVSLETVATENKQLLIDHLSNQSNSTSEAFHSAIELGNVNLLQLLMAEHKDENVENLIAKPYEELLSCKTSIRRTMRDYLEQQLVLLRSRSSQCFRLSEAETKQRIHFVCEQIQILYDSYSTNTRKIDEEFTSRAKRIAQNIHLLKRVSSLRKSNIPWEQIEFCLVTFIGFFLKPHKEDMVYRLILSRDRILNHLQTFGQTLHLYLDGTDQECDTTKLNDDFIIIKDIYSLNRISSYIKLALSASNQDNDETSPYVLMRCLQVIGESFKNTQDSLNLSEPIQEYLIISAPTDVKQIVTSLRDSLTHTHSYSMKQKIECKLMKDQSYFRVIQNDLRKVGLQIEFLMYKKKSETFNIFHQKCLKNPDDVENLCRYIDWSAHSHGKDVNSEDFEIGETFVIKQQVQKLRLAIPNPTEVEGELLEALFREIPSISRAIYKKLKKTQSLYFTKRSYFASLQDVEDFRYTDVFEVNLCMDRKTGIYNRALLTLQNLLCELQKITFVEQRHEAILICNELFQIMKWDTQSINSIKSIDTNLSGKSEDVDGYIFNVLCKIKESLDDERDKEKLEEYYKEKFQLHKALIWIKENLPNSLAEFDNLVNVEKKHKISLKKNINNKNLAKNLIANLDQYGQLIKAFNKGKFSANLKKFFSAMNNSKINEATMAYLTAEDEVLERIICNKLKLLGQILEMLDCNLSHRSAMEILLLDVLEACSQKGACIDYTLSFDEYAPVLIGTSLRNYLAHGTPLIDLLPFDPLNSIKSTAKLLIDRRDNFFALEPQSMHNSPNKNYREDHLIIRTEAPCEHSGSYESFLELVRAGDLSAVIDILKHTSLSTLGGVNSAVIWPAILVASKEGHTSVVTTLVGLTNKKKLKVNHRMDALTFKKFKTMLLKYEINIWSMIDKGTGMRILNESVESFLAVGLWLATENNHAEIVNIFLRMGATPASSTLNGKSVVHVAAENGYKTIMEALLGHDAFAADSLMLNMSTPLHLAASRGHHEIIAELLKHNVNIEAQESSLYTPLHLGAKNGYLPVVEVLVNHQANISASGPKGITPLHLAAQYNHEDVVRFLLQQEGINIQALDDIDNSPIDLAIIEGHSNIVQVLLDHGAQLITKNEFSPLIYAALYGHENVVKTLLDYGVDVNCPSLQGKTTLHLICVAGKENVFNILTDYGAKIEVSDEEGFTPLHTAAHFGSLGIVEMLIKKGAAVDVKTADSITPLYLAASHGYHSIVELLLKKNADPDISDINNDTPLHLSAHRGYRKIVDTLLDYSKKPDAMGAAGATPLHLAAEEGFTEIVTLLLTKGKVNVNAQDKDLRTPLHSASLPNRLETVKILIKFGADVNSRSSIGITPLHICAQQGCENVAEILLTNKATVDPVMKNDWTPLHITAIYGQSAVLRILLNHGANINKKTATSWTALHLAAKNGHSEVVKVLLDHGADAGIKTTDGGHTAWDLAIKNGHRELESLKNA